MDGFMPVSWKKTPCCGRARQQVAQQKRYRNSQPAFRLIIQRKVQNA